MAETYDIVVMGSGQNCLGAAAYLAKAGKKVLILERHSHIGGGAVTLERNLPGFKYDQHSAVHILIQANPLLLNDELGLLSKYGLKYHYPTAGASTILEDFRTLSSYIDIDRTCASIAQYSRRDADAYRQFAEWGKRILPMMLYGMFNPPVPMSSFMGMMEQSEDGRRLLDMMLRSPLQIVEEMFETDIVKIHLIKVITEHCLQMPDDMGTGLGMLLMPAFLHTYPLGIPIGGSGELSRALAECIAEHGGEIRTETEVAKVLVRGGRAVGLETTTGEQFMAKDAVIAAIHPRKLDQFISDLDADMLARGKRTRASPYSLLKVDAALSEPLVTKIPPELAEGIVENVFANTLSEFLSSFEPIRAHRPSVERPLVGGADMPDPSRAPEGKRSLYFLSYQPYNLADGGPQKWDEIKERVADEVFRKAEHFMPNINSAMMARNIDSPLDIERYSPNSMLEGDFSGLGFQMFHTGGYRPTPELAQYEVPGCSRLYLCGPFMHPGGGIFGVGRPTAIKICDDLGIDFDKVVS